MGHGTSVVQQGYVLHFGPANWGILTACRGDLVPTFGLIRTGVPGRYIVVQWIPVWAAEALFESVWRRVQRTGDYISDWHNWHHEFGNDFYNNGVYWISNSITGLILWRMYGMDLNI